MSLPVLLKTTAGASASPGQHNWRDFSKAASPSTDSWCTNKTEHAQVWKCPLALFAQERRGRELGVSGTLRGRSGNEKGGSNRPRAIKDERKWQNVFARRLGKGAPETQENRQPSQRRRKIKGWVKRKQEIMSRSKEASTALGCSPALLIEGQHRAHQLVTTPISAEAGATSPCRGPTHTLASQRAPRKQHVL